MIGASGAPSRLLAIVEANRSRVEELVARWSLDDLIARAQAVPAARRFRRALNGAGISLIAEVKKASPSAGLLCADFDPVRLARIYEAAGARAVSVLTEEIHFQGSPHDLTTARSAIDLPVLRKDFLVVPHQIAEARLWGADAVLLIAAILEPQQLAQMQRLAWDLGMDALVEVHDAAELDRALGAEANLIGVNNRNLHTFEVTLGTTFALRERVPRDRTFVSESGIKTRQDVERLQAAGVDAVLVGETLVRSTDPGAVISELLGMGKGCRG